MVSQNLPKDIYRPMRKKKSPWILAPILVSFLTFSHSPTFFGFPHPHRWRATDDQCLWERGNWMRSSIGPNPRSQSWTEAYTKKVKWTHRLYTRICTHAHMHILTTIITKWEIIYLGGVSGDVGRGRKRVMQMQCLCIKCSKIFKSFKECQWSWFLGTAFCDNCEDWSEYAQSTGVLLIYWCFLNFIPWEQ